MSDFDGKTYQNALQRLCVIQSLGIWSWRVLKEKSLQESLLSQSNLHGEL